MKSASISPFSYALCLVPLAFAASVSCAAASQTPAPSFDSARAFNHLRDLVGIGPRVAGTPENVKTRQYIINTLDSMGIKAVEQPFVGQTPVGPVKMANVIATLPGSRPERIILASHFDTKLFRDFRFVGASDSGSSTAALLELGRALRDQPRTFTIELLFLDGEEAVVEWGPTDSTYGSRHYVEAGRAANTLKSIKALVLLDMIGDKNLNIRREAQSTRWLTDLVWAAARRVGHQRYFLSETTPIEDDHVPFLQAGVPAVDIIDLDYPAWHTAADTLDNVSAQSLQVIGDVVLAVLPDIEAHVK